MNLADILARWAANGFIGLLGLMIGFICLFTLFLGALMAGMNLVGRRWRRDEETEDDLGTSRGIDAFRWTEDP